MMIHKCMTFKFARWENSNPGTRIITIHFPRQILDHFWLRILVQLVKYAMQVFILHFIICKHCKISKLFMTITMAVIKIIPVISVRLTGQMECYII